MYVLASPELDLAEALTDNKSDVVDAGRRQVVDPVRRIAVESQARRHHRLDVNKVKELLMEWKGDRGKARSVSNAAANLVVFAPLSPGRPKVVLPTAASETFQLPPPSTAPNNLSSLRAIVEKSHSDESEKSRSENWKMKMEEVATVAENDSHESKNAPRTELGAFKSGPETSADVMEEQVEDIGFVAKDQDYVTPVTGFHLRPRSFPVASHGDLGEPDRMASLSLLLPPDNDPWTLSEDPKLSPTEAPLPVNNNEDDVFKSAIKGNELGEVEYGRDRRTTTDPTVHMYTVLSAATSRRSNKEEKPGDVSEVKDDAKDDIDYDVRYDVGEEMEHHEDDAKDDVEYDVKYDEEKEVESYEEEGVVESHRKMKDENNTQSMMYDEETLQPDDEDMRQLSPEFLSVMQSLWPGLEICAGAHCNSKNSGEVTDIDDEKIDLSSTEFGLHAEYDDYPAASVKMTPDDATVTPTTPSSLQMRASTLSSEEDVSTTSPYDKLSLPAPASYEEINQLGLDYADNVELDGVDANDRDENTTSDEDQEREKKLTTTKQPTTTANGDKLVSKISDAKMSGQQKSQRTLTISGPANVIVNRPALGAPAEPTRSFQSHPFRADPTRREKSEEATTNQRPFHQRHNILPPIFTFHRNPTIVKHRPDLGGLSDRRRVEVLEEDDDSGLVETIDEIHFRRPDLFPNAALQPKRRKPAHPKRTDFPPQSSDHKKLFKRTTTKSLTGKLMNNVSEVSGVTTALTTIVEGRKTNPDETNDNAITSKSKADRHEKAGSGQAAHRSTTSVSKELARGQTIEDEVSSTLQLNPSSGTSPSDVEKGARKPAQSVVDSVSSGTFTMPTSSQLLHNKSTKSQQTVSDKITVPLTSSTTASEAISSRTTSNRPLSAASPGGSGEQLPVQARPGVDSRSAAAIAMLGGYADWMVGLISAVAVAVFIFLAILSFLAVVSCRCVSSR